MSITEQIQNIRIEFNSESSNFKSTNSGLEKIRIKYLGRKGLVAQLFQLMDSLDKNDRPKAGQMLNSL